MKIPYVKVVWLDSILDTSGWVCLDSYDFEIHQDSMRMETVGYCIKSTDKALFIAQSIGNNQISSVVSIPSGCILSIIKIKDS